MINMEELETQIEVEDSPELRKKKINNIKIYPIYRALTWDLLFYYSIIYLFFTIEKGMSVLQVFQIDAFYLAFKAIVQIPSTMVIEKLGKRRSLIIANFVLAIHILVIMLAPNFVWLIVSQALCAVAFVIKGTCETDMLYDSIPHGEKRGVKFSKIEGKATSMYYYIDAITAFASGFLFVINSYLPLILCFIVALITFFISTKFENIQEKADKIQIKEEIRDVKNSFRKIFKSKRLVSLLIFNIVFIFMIKALQVFRNTTLIAIGIPEQYFGVIFSIMGLIAGISARNQGRIHKKYRNRTLGFLAKPLATSCLLMGVILLFNMPMGVTLPITLILFTVQYLTKGPYYTLIKQYLNNFTDSKTRVRISTANNLAENIVVSILIFILSYIVEMIPISYSLLGVGAVSLIVVIFLLDYMKKTVGKKPEEYSKSDFLVKL